MKLRSAFTLLEVMLAIGIFVIGFVAVASMFPVAAHLQKQTVGDVVEKQFSRSMKTIINTVGTDAAITSAPINAVADGGVYDISDIVSENDRSYPSSSATKTVYSATYARYNLAATKWVFYTFMLRPQNGAAPAIATYPVVNGYAPNGTQATFRDTSGTLDISAGDEFMDNEGQTFTVFDFDAATRTITVDAIPAIQPTTIWAAPARLCKRVSVTTR